MKKIAFLVVVFGLILVACATTPQAPPTGAITAERPVLVLGSSFTFRGTNLLKKSGWIYTLVIEKKELYNANPAYWVRIDSGGSEAKMSNVYSIYNLEFNLMASIKEGKETFTAWPYIKRFSWPLFVGKEWASNYRHDDKVTGRWVEGVIEYVKVESYEEVRVPAGTFKAFKVKSGDYPSTHSFVQYYAPRIGMVIKQELWRSPYHPLGAGELVYELIRFQQ